MALKRDCRYCGTGNTKYICFNCREKLEVLKHSGVFGGKAKKKKRGNTPKLDAYTREMGSETQKLVDYVNKSGTIHYGRCVAQELLRKQKV